MIHSSLRYITFFVLTVMCLFVAASEAKEKQGPELLDSLQRELPKAKDDTTKASILTRIALYYRYIDPEQGIKYGIQASDLAEKEDWQTGLVSAYSALANNYLTKSEYVRSIEYYNKAEAICEAIGNRKYQAKNIINVGILYFTQGNYAKALENYFIGLKIEEEIKSKEDIASCLLNIGIVYSRQEKYTEALEYFFKSLKIAEEIGDKSGIAYNYGNIGLVYKAQKNYAKALEYYEKSLQLNEAKGAKAFILADLGNIGNVYRNQGDFPKAFEYFFRSLHIAEEIGDKFSTSISLGNIGEAYMNIAQDTTGRIKTDSLISGSKQANLAKAVSFIDRAMVISKDIGDIDGIQELSKNLATIHTMAGNYKEALANQIQYMQYRDSMFSEKNKMKMAGLETQRAIDLKERDIQIEKLKAANKRNERVMFIAGIALLLIAMGVVVKKFIVQSRSHRVLSHEKKKHLQRIKEQSNVLEDIAHTQSHEIRGQVVTIMGLSRLFNYDNLSDPVNKELMEGIAGASEKLDEIIKDVVTKENKFNSESKGKK